MVNRIGSKSSKIYTLVALSSARSGMGIQFGLLKTEILIASFGTNIGSLCSGWLGKHHHCMELKSKKKKTAQKCLNNQGTILGSFL